MIIFQDNSFTFCILHNPKCGTSSIKEYIIPQIVKKYKIIFNDGNKTIHESGYDNINYNHCNIKGAITFLRKKDINLDKTIFITTIRNPIQRVISTYFYELKLLNKKFWKYQNRQKDILEFLKWDHIIQFFPKNFRFFKKYKVNEIIKLENLKDEFTNLCKKYKLNLDTSGLINEVNKTSHESIVLNEHILKLIKNFYIEDFTDGKYEK